MLVLPRPGIYGAGYPKKYGGQGPEPYDIFHAFIL